MPAKPRARACPVCACLVLPGDRQAVRTAAADFHFNCHLAVVWGGFPLPEPEPAGPWWAPLPGFSAYEGGPGGQVRDAATGAAIPPRVEPWTAGLYELIDDAGRRRAVTAARAGMLAREGLMKATRRGRGRPRKGEA